MSTPQSNAGRYVVGALVVVIALALAGVRVAQVIKENRHQAAEKRAQQKTQAAAAKRRDMLARSRVQATAILKEALAAISKQEAGEKLDELLGDVARGQAKTGDRSTAVETARRISEARARQFVLADIAGILSTASRSLDVAAFQSAIDVSRAAPTIRFRVQGLAYVAVQQGEVDKTAASRTLQEAIQIVQDKANAPHTSEERWILALNWQDIAIVQARLGDLREALASTDRIPADDIAVGPFGPLFVSRVDALVSIAKAHFKAGEKKHAFETIDLALASVHRERDINRLSDLDTIIKAQIEAGDYSGAKASLGEALKLARAFVRRLDEKHKAEALAIVAVSLAKGRDVTGAMAIATEISADKPTTARTLGRIAAAIKESGLPDAAAIHAAMQQSLATAQGIPNAMERELVMQDVAKSQALSGDLAGSLETARAIANPIFRVAALMAIGVVQRDGIDVRGAITTLQEAQSVIRGADRKDVTEGLDETTSQLAGAQAKNGDFAAALITARTISDGPRRALTLEVIAELLVPCDGVKCSPPPS